MTELLDSSSTDSESTVGFDRETLGALLIRHPWAVRIAVVEAILLSIVLVIPVYWTSDFAHVLFGIVLSSAILIAMCTALIGVARGINRVRRIVRIRSSYDLSLR